MKISFDEIPVAGIDLDINDQSWFPGGEFRLLGSVTARIFLRKTDKRVKVKGLINCPVQLECDRCLGDFATELESEFSIFFDWVGVQDLLDVEAEHQLTGRDLEVVELASPIIDIFTLLRQQFYLMLPAKVICENNCKGLCTHCGKNLNHGLCSCSGSDDKNPFSILSKLKDN